MVFVTSNKPRRLLCLQYIGRVLPHELESLHDEIRTLLADLPSDIRLLADLSLVESIDPECEAEIGRVMDLLDEKGVSLIVRVIPDPSKDIGLSILSIFHYPQKPRAITCQTLAEALQRLAADL